MIKRYLRRFPHALHGLRLAIFSDFSFITQVIVIGPITLLFAYIFSPLTTYEILFLVVAWFLILITEIQNSALEEALDKIHPEHHKSIGASKDMAAASTLLAGIFLVIVLTVIAVT